MVHCTRACQELLHCTKALGMSLSLMISKLNHGQAGEPTVVAGDDSATHNNLTMEVRIGANSERLRRAGS